MKKLILMSANFMAINTIQLISCGVSEKNNSEKKPESKPSKSRPQPHSKLRPKPHPKPDPNKPKPNKPKPNKPKPNKPDPNKPDLENDNVNYILDFETREKPIVELSMPEYRSWAGTLNDKKSMNKLLKSKIVPYESFNNEQVEFIKKFTTVLNTAASKKALKNLIIFKK